ncbi:hypothetical protein E2C01_015459 [Portunus trituberculatus]|uniref:Uncharacterized protein n=1 Tax=Portunus trituberculatus TaxID=210409 RepID=A0A5B7DN42_PORTR|nr:hypothetical protein [Portunus trituberculatus]
MSIIINCTILNLVSLTHGTNGGHHRASRNSATWLILVWDRAANTWALLLSGTTTGPSVLAAVCGASASVWKRNDVLQENKGKSPNTCLLRLIVAAYPSHCNSIKRFPNYSIIH